jgi:hypothetical protein
MRAPSSQQASYRAGLLAVALCALAGSSCFDKNQTGFIITVFRPDTTVKAPGVDYNMLSVDVTTSNGAEKSVKTPITSLTPAPYVVLVLFNNAEYTEVQSIAVSLLLNQTVISAYNLPSQPIVEHELTPINVDLTAQ